MKKNPHMSLRALDPPGRADRNWQCVYCKAEGKLDDLFKTRCSYVYPPCKTCCQTPECAIDCPAILKVLRDHVAGRKS